MEPNGVVFLLILSFSSLCESVCDARDEPSALYPCPLAINSANPVSRKVHSHHNFAFLFISWVHRIMAFIHLLKPPFPRSSLEYTKNPASSTSALLFIALPTSLLVFLHFLRGPVFHFCQGTFIHFSEPDQKISCDQYYCFFF